MRWVTKKLLLGQTNVYVDTIQKSLASLLAWIIVAVSSLMAPITSCGSIFPIISISSICCPAASSFKYLPSSLLHPGSSSRSVLITLLAFFTKILAVSTSPQGISRNAKSRWCLRWKVTWHPGMASTSSSSFSLQGGQWGLVKYRPHPHRTAKYQRIFIFSTVLASSIKFFANSIESSNLVIL